MAKIFAFQVNMMKGQGGKSGKKSQGNKVHWQKASGARLFYLKMVSNVLKFDVARQTPTDFSLMRFRQIFTQEEQILKSILPDQVHKNKNVKVEIGQFRIYYELSDFDKEGLEEILIKKKKKKIFRPTKLQMRKDNEGDSDSEN